MLVYQRVMRKEKHTVYISMYNQDAVLLSSPPKNGKPRSFYVCFWGMIENTYILKVMGDQLVGSNLKN